MIMRCVQGAEIAWLLLLLLVDVGLKVSRGFDGAFNSITFWQGGKQAFHSISTVLLARGKARRIKPNRWKQSSTRHYMCPHHQLVNRSTTSLPMELSRQRSFLQLSMVILLMNGVACLSFQTRCPPNTIQPGNSSCSNYTVQDNCAGRVVQQTCSGRRVFSDYLKACVPFNSLFDSCTRENAVEVCDGGYKGFIPHPTECQSYYNCSQKSYNESIELFGVFGDECIYPDLFDVEELKCKPFKVSFCGIHRLAEKDKCAYRRTLKCELSRCIPCSVLHPSCVGLEDGRNAVPSRKWSPYFIGCDSERLVEYDQICPRHNSINTTQIFHPERRQCVSPFEIPPKYGGAAKNCEGKSAGLHVHTQYPQVYFKCPEETVLYCPKNTKFNEQAQLCEPI